MKIQSGFSLKALSPQEKAAKLDQGLKDAAKMYESHFLNEMVKSMRSTVNKDDSMIKENMAEKIFSQQLDSKYVESWSNKGGVGLADMIYTQIREKYFGSTKKDFSHGGGVMPIAPKKEAHGLKSPDSIQMKAIPPSAGNSLEYRFEVPDPSSGGFEAQVPLTGKVMESSRLGDSWNVVRLDHGQGLQSELTFPGSFADFEPGQTMEAGQKLGVLDSGRPVLAWKLDWI